MKLEIGQRWKHNEIGYIVEILEPNQTTAKCKIVQSANLSTFSIGYTNHWCAFPFNVEENSYWTYLIGQDKIK